MRVFCSCTLHVQTFVASPFVCVRSSGFGIQARQCKHHLWPVHLCVLFGARSALVVLDITIQIEQPGQRPFKFGFCSCSNKQIKMMGSTHRSLIIV